ncbi:MAG: class II fructose-bisphosphate aldolase [Parcubacteria group bacterium]|nr:class II fructose-bisphosphate aldolase [Parcubacteria group bacterium]
MNPISGKSIYSNLKDQDCIVMACNVRVTKGVAKGIFRAAKKKDAAVVFEIAKSESNLEGGYTGMTPEDYKNNILEGNKEIGHDIWALHADHIGVKEGTEEELDEVKKLIKAQIEAGFTSYAIDASHLFNFEGGNLEEELKDNVKATTELAKYIKEEKQEDFGLEVEVGEIGKKGDDGRILTTPEEAVTFIKALKGNGVEPDLLAIANGSAHGNTFDADGNLVEQVSIDIPQTIAVGKALQEAGLEVGIAQHGITGTPLSIVKDKFPKQYLKKGNVGTHWLNLVWEIFEQMRPEFYKKIYDWTLENYAEEGKSDMEVFGKNSKHAIKEFYDEFYNMDEGCEKAVEEKAYNEAVKFFDAFNAEGTGKIVRENL